ncbi:MAG: Glutamate synthase (NADPH) small chain [Syntrophorhabdus sp. PtaB.Bin184]|jgi:NADPH-dependent glutamate synthase beta subunit-like oxidoreductase/2,4-dienoyl-CoA reductase-like NADH-dependent reductase (Old Yellow Enzyme family)|nr:MAG: Glutamate synthase (NADPH) small chain [Syntrophorhabdus sp. PtaB.Bin184]
MKYKRLFSPLKVGSCVFPNRIMSTAAVTRLASEEGHITPNFVERYRRLAEGGLGAMVVEAAVVLPSKSSFNLRISDDAYIEELKKFVDEIRKANREVKVGIQLIHFLKVARSGWRQKVEDLKAEEIGVIPGQFASSARRARAAGFDFVELHMAHFTTLASFLSLVNKRQDEYGGDFEGRVKLPAEVVNAAREAVGDDYTIGVRMLGEEFTKEGNTLLQSARVARRLASLGADYISVSAGERFEDADPPLENFPPFAGTGYSGYRMSPRWWNPDGVQVYLADGIRKAVRQAGYEVPIVCAGKVRTPDLAEKILEEGRSDIIGMARALFADPDWPVKAREDRADEIVKCAACGYCSEADERYETVVCIEWPKGALSAPSPWLLAPPCKAACPAGLDIRSYIDLTAQGEYEKALSVIEEKIPFPASVSRVCPHPCERSCNRGAFDQPIAINALKRFLVDTVRKAKGRKKVEPFPRTRDERVAVIGSGPAGMTAAFGLAKLGYPVTVFEAAPVPGGMLMLGIPEYRLPKKMVREEIDDIEKRGVEIRLNTLVGEGGISFDSLREEGFKAIVVAIGAHKSVSPGIEGEGLQGVYHGVSFLKAVNLGSAPSIGERVVVIGGGNVAVDAARTVQRMGAKEVTIVYRRSKDEMPAYPGEIEAATVEGVKIVYLVAPVGVTGKDGKAAGLRCVRTELGAPDESGRRTAHAVKGSEFEIAADSVILAVGETPDPGFFKSAGFSMKVQQSSQWAGEDGIFACGDVVTGPATVIEAIAAGRRAATGAHRYLRGESVDYTIAEPAVIPVEDVEVERFKKREREKMPALHVSDRVGNFREVELGFTELMASSEAERCFQCGMFPRKDKNIR